MSNYFDLTKGNVDEISIYKTNGGGSCYIAHVGNKTVFYSGFILNDKATVQTICDVDFHPSSISSKYVPRLTFKIIKKKDGEIKAAQKEMVRISFKSSDDGYQYFWIMIGFLNKFKDLVDVGDFDRSFKVIDSDAFILEFKDKEQSEKILQLSKILTEGNLDEESIRKALVNSRREALNDFESLLHDEEYEIYRSKYSGEISDPGEEAVWYHFLKKHLWIIGLGIDIRFIRDLVGQVNVGVQNTEGIGSPVADLLGISDYTLLVELKTPNSPIFTESKSSTSRANTWSFSSKFIDGISQCLGQKCDWEKNHKQKDLVANDGEVVNQDRRRTVDPKTVFVIGNRMAEFPDDSQTPENLHKRDTFQRFRRNNRNVDIVTFDELYEKAHYIVHGELPSEKLIIPVDLPF